MRIAANGVWDSNRDQISRASEFDSGLPSGGRQEMSATEDSRSDDPGDESNPRLRLQYQRMLFRDILATDGLLILARGLGLLTLVSHLLYAFDNPKVASAETGKTYKNFVVMIGAESREETLIGQNIAELVTKHGGAGTGLQVVNTDKVGVDQRSVSLGTVYADSR